MGEGIQMFMHAGLRPLWPVIAFVPWLFLGVGYLLQAARHKLRALPLSRTRQLHVVGVLGLVLLAGTRAVMADPAAEEAGTCVAANTQEARTLADRLYEQGEYQRAAACYQAAGDLPRANLAFLKATRPAAEDTARGLKSQRDTAKALFSGVAQAFRGNQH
jgi:hypothetical protein